MNSELLLPEEFQKTINALLETESGTFFKALSTSPPSAIRINPRKNLSLTETTNVPWCNWGKYLNARPVYTLDPSFHAGAYYVQEPSSMFLEQAIKTGIDTDTPITALDLCAAPGGKSTHLLSLLHPDSLLVSNEVIRSRANILSENIQKWGHHNVLVTNNDPSHFTKLEGLFDLILVDAPCSGEGLFRKDNEALKEWSPENVELCSLRQRRILKDIWPSLKQNGVLIFCTCTYNTKEDEGTMEWLRQTGDCEFISIPINPQSGIVEAKYNSIIGYRFYPHKVKGEGFFISVVRKLSAQKELRIHTKNKLGEKVNRDAVASWVKNHDQFDFINIKGLIHAVPKSNMEFLNFLGDKLSPVLIGMPLASDKHGKLVPEHCGSLSIDLNQSNFSAIALNREQAIQYLRKEVIELGTNEKGFTLITYENNPIGWVNVLSNRVNNLYPANWRIRMKPS